MLAYSNTAAVTGMPPSLSLRFTEQSYWLGFAKKKFADLITFTRASGAGRFNSEGKYEWIPNTRTNLLTYSQDLDNAQWTRQNATLQANAGVAPDGSNNADKLTEDTTTSALHRTHSAYVGVPSTAVASIYVKAAGRDRILLFLHDGTNRISQCTFDLVSCSITAGAASNGRITSVGNGWYRCEIWASTLSATTAVYISLTDGGAETYSGNGTSGVLLWGCQMETGTKATDYIPTTDAAVTVTNNAPRIDYDPVTKECLGLLIEEQRTNLAVNSTDFSSWAKERCSVVADGTFAGLVAHRVTVTEAGQQVRLRSPQYTVAAGSVTASVYVKAGTTTKARLFFDPLGGNYPGSSTLFDTATGFFSDAAPGFAAKSVGDGWWRLSLSRDVTSSGPSAITVLPGISNVNSPTSADVGQSILVCAPQVEQGAFPTSYIPTAGSAVTRAKDEAYAPTSGWLNPSDGTVACFGAIGQGYAPHYAALQTGALSNYEGARVFHQAGTDRAIYRDADGPDKNLLNLGGVNQKRAMMYSHSGQVFKGVSGAGTAVSSASLTGEGIANSARLYLGSRNGAELFLNGHIKRIDYYPKAMTDTQLQGLTA